MYLVPAVARREDQLHRSGVTDGHELPCECWQPNPGPLREHNVLLTTGSSPQLWILFLSQTSY